MNAAKQQLVFEICATSTLEHLLSVIGKASDQLSNRISHPFQIRTVGFLAAFY
ncbi:hypothetical protein [Bacillus changyiensis]|uniref:hypothetical protein n=1 Tax=Bacillus changyiensis TaxID=3004103 RepID=UPI0022DF5406|nr:hypothetical protein [Bacillus changyiensis]MDA1475821.1 hypothetical protein [Bacillus changyiensis]